MAGSSVEALIRANLIEQANQLLPGRDELRVILVRGDVLVVTPEAAAPPAPPELSAYDAAIVAAAGDRAMSLKRLAHLSGHRHNSYFRQRVAALVESGQLRHTRRGYSRVGG